MCPGAPKTINGIFAEILNFTPVLPPINILLCPLSLCYLTQFRFSYGFMYTAIHYHSSPGSLYSSAAQNEAQATCVWFYTEVRAAHCYRREEEDSVPGEV